MLNFNFKQFALSMLQRNPQVKNNPQAQGLINVIQTEDSKQGEQFAENLCKTYGVSKEQALADARKFFHI